MSPASPTTPSPPLTSVDASNLAEFERTLDKIAEARPFAKAVHQPRAFALAEKLLKSDEGIEALYQLAPRFDTAGLFDGGDWATPQTLEPALVRATLQAEGMYSALESLNQLRFLAIANGDASHPELSSEDAFGYLEEVLASNLDLPFPEATEFTRGSKLQTERLQRLLRFVLEHLETQRIVGALASECERVLLQRPIMVQRVTTMLRSVEPLLSAEATPIGGVEYDHARWMIEAMNGPSELAQRHPAPADYEQALASLDAAGLEAEVGRFGQRMNESGLVSPAHATLLRFVAASHPALIADGLALNRIGRTSLAEHAGLVAAMMERAVLPETAQCIYGLSRLLNRGILFFPPVPPALEGLLVARIDPAVGELLRLASGLEAPPDPGALLLAGTLSVIGQPRGVDQGHNPTCQAARAISLWSQNDVGYLLELILRAATENDVLMHFEGESIRGAELSFGLAEELHTELDPVSLVLTPHLDKIYMEMSRRTIGRDEDGHRWVNPEFHGWWVYTGFASLVDIHTGGIQGFETFVRTFHAAYHPGYNGGRNLVYAQPCGVVSTGPNAEFVGWHAVSIQRVALDPSGAWRVYFFNPNRDKGQNWGHDIVTETCNNGELEGESSLPFEQFLMRLYVFHFDPRDVGSLEAVPADAVERVRAEIASSWAGGRAGLD